MGAGRDICSARGEGAPDCLHKDSKREGRKEGRSNFLEQLCTER